MLDDVRPDREVDVKNALMVTCENCGQEELVEASRPDGTAMLPGEFRAQSHRMGEMVVCDRCAGQLGYPR